MAMLFIGVTTWNSELFIAHSLAAWQRLTRIPARIVVWDNASDDATPRLVAATGVEVVRRASSQADALNGLWKMAREPTCSWRTPTSSSSRNRWFELCAAAAADPAVALVSPEDVGCGPYTRPFGAGMPESSFLFADRKRLGRTARLEWGAGEGYRRRVAVSTSTRLTSLTVCRFTSRGGG